MRIEWSAPASEDRDAIFDYVEADNPSAAIGVDNRIREQVGDLGSFPELGRPGRVEGTRELVIVHTPYIAAYRIADGTVTVLRILHGAQLWPVDF
jgi:addiction module RelE/StbE family toxin